MKYKLLEEGEIIQEGDEIQDSFLDSKGWRKIKDTLWGFPYSPLYSPIYAPIRRPLPHSIDFITED